MFPRAQLCFDRFHVMKLCGESLEAIRKEVAREHGGLPRGAMWALRGNPENLKEEQRNLREQICKEHGKIARALSIREFLSDLWNYQFREDAEQHLESVLSWCSRSRLQPFIKLGKDAQEAHGRHLGILQQLHDFRSHRGCQRPATTRTPQSQGRPDIPQLPSDGLDCRKSNYPNSSGSNPLKVQQRLFLRQLLKE